MTVVELIHELKQFDDHLEVKFAYDYGDRNHSKVTGNINYIIREGLIDGTYGERVAMDGDYEDEDYKERIVSEAVILSTE